MRKCLCMVGLLVAVATPAWAVVINVGTIYEVPETATWFMPTRPAVDALRIIAGQHSTGGLNGTMIYNPVTQVGQEWQPAAGTRMVQPSGYGQNNTIGLAGNWAGLGGAATGGSNPSNVPQQPLYFGQLVPTTLIPVVPTTAQSDEHFPDVNYKGEAIWTRWDAGSTFSIMYKDLANAGATTPLITGLGAGGDSNCANWADYARRFVYSTPTQHIIYDMATATSYPVYTKTTESNILRARISDDGNWIVANVRPASETLKRAHIVLTDVTNPSLPVSYNLTGADMSANSANVIREDPNIEIVDADTAIVVWGECVTPEASNIYYIQAAVVTGLAPGGPVPTMGAPVLLASSDKNLHFPDIDGSLVAWVKDYNWLGGAGQTSQVLQYMFIPEPATASLLLLGGMALARRR